MTKTESLCPSCQHLELLPGVNAVQCGKRQKKCLFGVGGFRDANRPMPLIFNCLSYARGLHQSRRPIKDEDATSQAT